MRSTEDNPPEHLASLSVPCQPLRRDTAGRLVEVDIQHPISVLIGPLPNGWAAREARTIIRGLLQREGLEPDDVFEAELAVDELAANAEKHARPPYELRVLAVGGIPTWCEIVDADPDLGWIPALLTRSAPPLLVERGRGLALVRELSQGHCRAYPTVITTYAAPGKAIAFALPTRSGTRLTCPSPLDLGRRPIRLRSS